MPACLCYNGLFRPCHALSACLCLDPMPASPCVLHLPLYPSITMCPRIIAQVAGTALQAAPPTIVFACVSAHSVFCRDCPACSRTRGLHWCSPCTVLCSLLNCAHFKGEAKVCIGQPATFPVHTCICFMSQRLHLGSLAPCFKYGLWDGIWHAGLG